MDDVRVSAAAKVLQAVEAANHGGEYPLSEFLEDAEAMLKAADAVDPLRNRRIIETVEDLDALADGAVVRSEFGVPLEKCVESPECVYWAAPGSENHYSSRHISLPAVVLFESSRP